MGVYDLLQFIEAHCPNACVSVDLLRLARGIAVTKKRIGAPDSEQFALVVDGESCLDRLYGGFFSDWICGGQWNRMVQFLAILVQTCYTSGAIELYVYFNGAIEQARFSEYGKLQSDYRRKIAQVIKHIYNKGTPPPKIWWVPPPALHTSIRLALQYLGVSVLYSMDDHHQEVIACCRENNFFGLLAQDSEYAIFDPPRYFSSQQLKLTFKGNLETKEYIMDEVAKTLDLHPNRFCLFASLLGNHILAEECLTDFHKMLLSQDDDELKGLENNEKLIRAVVAFVRALPSTDNLEAVGDLVFKTMGKDKDPFIAKLRNSVQYYNSGTKEGFLQYHTKIHGGRRMDPTAVQRTQTKTQSGGLGGGAGSGGGTSHIPPLLGLMPGQMMDPSQFTGNRFGGMSMYSSGGMGYGAAGAPQIVIEPPGGQTGMERFNAEMRQRMSHDSIEARMGFGMDVMDGGGLYNNSFGAGDGQIPALSRQMNDLTFSSSDSGNSTPNHRLSPEAGGGGYAHPQAKPQIQHRQPHSPHQKGSEYSLPKIPPEVVRISSQRHQKGLMAPWIYQVLSQGELKLSICLEEEVSHDLPSVLEVYRPLRQSVYAILFNLNHHMFLARKKLQEQKETESGERPSTPPPSGGYPLHKEKETEKLDVPRITIKEWVYKKKGMSCDAVDAVALEWSVPSVQRLWLGHADEDRNRRLRAFFSCMRSDVPLMLNSSYVPLQYILLCSVLRFMLQHPHRRILQKHELDAFLAQAVSPQLVDVETVQNMKLPMVTVRGVHLAALFMSGVEHALFANDACGAPIPVHNCFPWLYFDGKLFHSRLLKASNNKPLVDLCEGQVEQVAKVERMRQAILQGLRYDDVFARPQLPGMPGMGLYPSPPPFPLHLLTAGTDPLAIGRGIPPPLSRGGRVAAMTGPPVYAGKRSLLSRGGKLEIAGVVVGNWGANLPGTGRGMHISPQVTSVGGMRRGGSRNFSSRARGGRPANVGRSQGNKGKRNNKPGSKSAGGDAGRGRGCTVEADDGEPIEANDVHTKDDSHSDEEEDDDDDDTPCELAPKTEDLLDPTLDGEQFTDADDFMPKTEIPLGTGGGDMDAPPLVDTAVIEE